MTEREAFVAWLEVADPKLPTTHDVEVAWRAWQARAALSHTTPAAPEVDRESVIEECVQVALEYRDKCELPGGNLDHGFGANMVAKLLRALSHHHHKVSGAVHA